MLPVEEFDSADALRQRFVTLRGRGATPGGFRGLVPLPVVVDARVPGKSLRATLVVPEQATFFGDHFPRRPVFPATLLLDAQMRLAVDLAGSIDDARAVPAMMPSRMTNVKMRTFITPGQRVGINVELLPSTDEAGLARLALSAHVGDRAVATARVDLVARALA
jgi:3-hydroxymyristoyl/3-hydroxydecanoyl-(acyl carrier protein) dehydratase